MVNQYVIGRPKMTTINVKKMQIILEIMHSVVKNVGRGRRPMKVAVRPVRTIAIIPPKPVFVMHTDAFT